MEEDGDFHHSGICFQMAEGKSRIHSVQMTQQHASTTARTCRLHPLVENIFSTANEKRMA